MIHLTHRILLGVALYCLRASAHAEQLTYENAPGDGSGWSAASEEGGGGSSYLGVDIADVTADRLADLKLKEERGAEITMVDQDAPAAKAGLREHDVILSMNGTAVESAAQLRRMIKETPPGRVVTFGISRDGQPMTIKAQLADRKKALAYEPRVRQWFHMPEMPMIPDFEPPISVVIAHTSARSGLMVENITPQLGDFFGVKNGNGVLVRSVEKGSRAEKAGFHAGDVVVKVNDQPVHDTSDFTHALRSASGDSAAIIVVRERKEQNLRLPLPPRRDSGSLLENSLDFDVQDLTVEAQKELSRVGDDMARLGPTLQQIQRQIDWQELEKKLEDAQRKIEQHQQKLLREFSGSCAEI